MMASHDQNAPPSSSTMPSHIVAHGLKFKQLFSNHLKEANLKAVSAQDENVNNVNQNSTLQPKPHSSNFSF